MSIEETLRAPLHVPFGAGYDIPPPKARVALRVQKYTSAVVQAFHEGATADIPSLLRRVGLDPDVTYSAEVDLLGDLYEPMLDDLTAEEFGRVSRAMIAWSMPGVTRETVEASLLDPTKAPAQLNRAARRKASRGSTSAASKTTGTP